MFFARAFANSKMLPIRETKRVCLVGPLVTDDWALIRNLKSKYLVTLAEQLDFLLQSDCFKEARLLVLDCSQDSDAVLEWLGGVKRNAPDLFALVVDGKLTQKQIAQAFQNGAKDFFTAPYDLALLIERIDSLCANRGNHESSSEASAGNVYFQQD